MAYHCGMCVRIWALKWPLFVSPALKVGKAMAVFSFFFLVWPLFFSFQGQIARVRLNFKFRWRKNRLFSRNERAEKKEISCRKCRNFTHFNPTLFVYIKMLWHGSQSMNNSVPLFLYIPNRKSRVMRIVWIHYMGLLPQLEFPILYCPVDKIRPIMPNS